MHFSYIVRNVEESEENLCLTLYLFILGAGEAGGGAVCLDLVFKEFSYVSNKVNQGYIRVNKGEKAQYVT